MPLPKPSKKGHIFGYCIRDEPECDVDKRRVALDAAIEQRNKVRRVQGKYENGYVSVRQRIQLILNLSRNRLPLRAPSYQADLDYLDAKYSKKAQQAAAPRRSARLAEKECRDPRKQRLPAKNGSGRVRCRLP